MKKTKITTKNFPVLERENLKVGKITCVKGMMPLLRKGGKFENICAKLLIFCEAKNLTKFDNIEQIEKHVLRTVARIKKEIKIFEDKKSDGKNWWCAYKIVSTKKDNYKLALNFEWKGM